MTETSERVAEIVGRLTREEKLALVHGATDPAGESTGYVPGVDRLDVPPLRLVDGPLGVRTNTKPATAFPASISLAASFDPSLGRAFGGALARETRALDQDVILGPGTNVVRVPQCGRNFEYFSEDPVVASLLTTAVVEGIQAEDVVATVKHYVANNQETNRCAVSADVDERTLRELYLRPFRAAVEADVGAVMTAYNRVNGTHMSDHEELVAGVLKDEWGFDGFVMSDWYGTESTVGAATGGLDLEMPGVSIFDMLGKDAPESDDVAGGSDDESVESAPDALDVPDDFDPSTLPGGIPDMTRGKLFGEPLAEAIEDGRVSEDRLDDMVTRILGQMERFGILDDEQGDGVIDTPAHRDLAQEIAVRGTVLLSNDEVLPLDDDESVALVGPHAEEARLGGGGSSEVTPFQSTTPAESISDRSAGSVTVEAGIDPIPDLSLFDMLPFTEEDEPEADSAETEPDFDAAVASARDADVAVVLVRDAATEAEDRETLALPGRQDELVEAVAEANDRTVVVVHSSGPVELPWRDEVAAIVESWYPGQAHGDALAAVLYGDADPSGRLPVTFAPEETYPTTTPERYPGVDGVARYDEGLDVGYRHFDATGVDPTYPFGHGLSYASFDYGSVETVDDSTVRVTVENTAERAGRDVVQAYVRPPESGTDDRPVRELAGFESVAIDAGSSVTVDVELDENAIGRYDVDEGWTVDAGTYDVEVGRSAGDVRGTTTLER